MFRKIRAQATRKRSDEQVTQSVIDKGPDSKGHSLKHIAPGKLKQSKEKGKDVSLDNWFVKKEKEKRAQNLVFCKAKENHEVRRF